MKVAIHLTHDCNLRCTYCYVGKKYSKTMSPETAEKAVLFGFGNSTRRVDFSFFGGEPLLERETLFRTVDFAEAERKTLGFALPVRYFVTTNGMCLDEPTLRGLADRDVRVSLSLDGHGEGHDLTRTLPDGSGSWETLAARFPAILRVFPSMEVLMTLTPGNVRHLGKGVENLYYCGFRTFMIGANYEEEWPEDALESMKEGFRSLGRFYLERFRKGDYIYISLIDSKIASHTRLRGEICSCCDKNDGEIAIAPSGNLYPCLRFVKGDEDHSLVIGTLESGIDKKRRAAIMLEAGREWAECRSCGYLGRCFHYCSAVNFKVNGAFNKPPAVLCHEEQMAIAVADSVAGELYGEKNPLFLKRFYG